MDIPENTEPGTPEAGNRRYENLRNWFADRRNATAVVGVIGGIAVLFGAYSLSGAIHGPFLEQATKQQRVARADLEKIAALRSVDTDKDGLSDFDELYRFHTSPYLADTDSDKTSDFAEVAASNDPNCPTGATCGPVASANTNVSGNSNSGTAAAALTGTLSAAELRQVLAGAGAPQYLLDATPDDQLLRLYQDTVGAANVNLGLTNGSVPASAVGNLTAGDIRKLLSQNGVDVKTLEGVDDATLLSIFRQSLEDVQQ